MDLKSICEMIEELNLDLFDEDADADEASEFASGFFHVRFYFGEPGIWFGDVRVWIGDDDEREWDDINDCYVPDLESYIIEKAERISSYASEKLTSKIESKRQQKTCAGQPTQRRTR